MEFENSTEQVEAQSGEQESVVDSPIESPTAEADAGQGGAVDTQQNADFAMVDTDSGEAGEDEPPQPDGAGRDGAKQQTREENSAIKAARLRAQRDAAAAAARQADEDIAKSGVVNPYTGQPFRSMQEFRDYGNRVRQAEIAQQAKKTGRCVEEVTEDAANREFLTGLRQAAERQGAAAERAREQKRFFENDVLDFIEKYPQFDQKSLAELENNQKFRRFCGSRFGREPLADLYGAYLEVVGEAGAAAVAKATSRQQRSTGSGSTGGVQLSPAQKAVLDQWNAEHPEMAMTAKEFLKR